MSGILSVKNAKYIREVMWLQATCIGENNDKIVLVNTDCVKDLHSLNIKTAYVVTYGLSSKATLTASSIEDDHIVICLQRTVTDLFGREIDPQEFNMSFAGRYNPSAALKLAAVCILSGVPIEKFSKFVF